MGRALHFSFFLPTRPAADRSRSKGPLPLFWACECSTPLAAVVLRREISGDIHLRPKQPTLHNLPELCPPAVAARPAQPILPPPCPMAHVWLHLGPRRRRRCAISHHHLENDKKARALLPLSLPLMHHSHYLNYVERE